MPGLDVAIAGGGPAGSTAAILLARTGLRVALVDDGAAPDRIEGLSARVVAMLDRLGLPAAGIGPATPRAVAWGGAPAAANREHLVARRAFDEGLRAAAAEAGVEVRRAVVARVGPGALIVGGERIAARVVVEARGRRAAARAPRRGPATVSIAGRVAAGGGDGAAITALGQGWLWRAGLGGLDWAQLTLDAAAAKAGLAAAWRGATDLPFPERPLVRAAEIRLAAPRFDAGVLRLGDAAVAMDPLSGHGVFWALSAALGAPPLVRAVFEGETALAARWHADRVVGTFLRQARIGRDFHAASGLDGPFWRVRRAWPDGEPAHLAPPAPALRPAVVVRDGRLVEAEALVAPGTPDGAAFVLGVEIAPVIRRLGGLGAPAAVARACPELPPDKAAAIAAWLVEAGAARPAAEAA